MSVTAMCLLPLSSSILALIAVAGVDFATALYRRAFQTTLPDLTVTGVAPPVEAAQMCTCNRMLNIGPLARSHGWTRDREEEGGMLRHRWSPCVRHSLIALCKRILCKLLVLSAIHSTVAVPCVQAVASV